MSINFEKLKWGIRALLNKPLYGKMGKMCYIGRPCFIANKKRIKMKNRVRIYPGMRSETLDGGTVEIGNNVSIGQNFHIVAAEKKVSIGNNVTISGNVFISNCDHTFDDENKMTLELPLTIKDTSIGDASFVGYGVVILAGTHIGKHCIIGANSVVRGNFPDNTMIAGNPARILKTFSLTDKKWERCEVNR